MLDALNAPLSVDDVTRAAARWHVRLQYAAAWFALGGVGVLAAIILSKSVYLGADSANDYAHVWYISDQIFHHGRLPLHFAGLESGHALTFPYGVAPWIITAIPYAIIGDRAVTAAMIAAFVFYGYAATRARPVLRDPRLLALIYINTYLLEGLVSFQMSFLWSCGFFFLFVEAVDKRRWPWPGALAALAITTHPFAGGAAVAGYAVYAAVRRPREMRALVTTMVVAALIVLPFALYIRTAPAVGSTHEKDLVATLRLIARYRGLVIALPLMVSAFAPAFRSWYLLVFAAMAVTFLVRANHKKVDTFGLDRSSQPFYGAFIDSPQFDRALTYRVLEPNDREDGAYQLIEHGAVLGQEFFDQSQFRRWWNTPDQYACFLGAKHIDVVLLEKDYPLKFSQNEDVRLREFEAAGKAHVVYADAGGRFVAYDVRTARRDGVTLGDCGL